VFDTDIYFHDRIRTVHRFRVKDKEAINDPKSSIKKVSGVSVQDILLRLPFLTTET